MDNVKDLLETAKKYRLNSLEAKCTQFMESISKVYVLKRFNDVSQIVERNTTYQSLGFSVDKPVQIIGLGFLGSNSIRVMDIIITVYSYYVYKNGKIHTKQYANPKIFSSIRATIYCDGNDKIYQIYFKNPINVLPGTKYVIDYRFLGVRKSYVCYDRPLKIMANGVAFTFVEANSASGGPGCQELAEIYFQMQQ